MNDQAFDVQKSCEAQKKLCDEKNYPHFAPSDGICYDCRRQIYSKIEHNNMPGHKPYYSGISVDRASGHITGCPHCHYSYCE